jgi:DNA mismatch repair ATPase MutS
VAFVQMGSFFEALGEHADLMVENAMVRSFVRGGVRVAGVQVATHARAVRMLLGRGFLVALHEQFEVEAPTASDKRKKGPARLERRRTRVYTPASPPQQVDADDAPDGGGGGDGDSRVLISAFCCGDAVGFASLDAATGRVEVASVGAPPEGAAETRLLRLENIGKGRDATACDWRATATETAGAIAAHYVSSRSPVEAIVAYVSSSLGRGVEAAARASGAYVTCREVPASAALLSAAYQDALLCSAFGEAARRSMMGVDDSLGVAGYPECKAALCELARYVTAASPEGMRGVIPPGPGGSPGRFGGANMAIEGGCMRQLDADLLLSMCVQPLTAAGRREMRDRLFSPLTDPGAIRARLDAVETCGRPMGGERPSGVTVGDGIRAALKGAPDPLRCVRRLASGSASPCEWERLVKGCDAALGASECFSSHSPKPSQAAEAAEAHAALCLAVLGEVDPARAAEVGCAGPTQRDHYKSFFVRGAAPRIDEMADALDELEVHLDQFTAALNDAGGAIGDPVVSEVVRDGGGSFLITTPARFKRIKSGASAGGTWGERLRLPEIVGVGVGASEAAGQRGGDGAESGAEGAESDAEGVESGADGADGYEVTGATVAVPGRELRHSGARSGFFDGGGKSVGADSGLEPVPANAVLHRRLSDLGVVIKRCRTALRAAVAERHAALARRIVADMSMRAALLSDTAAALDVSAALAATAARDGLARPVVMDADGFAAGMSAERLRHPIVAAQDRAETIVGNDVELTPARQGFVVFGVNASGKSTLLKACGLAVVAAQAGWFVAADSMVLRPFGALHARISTTDDIGAGRSLFQSECLEMRRVMELAGPGSLVLADEPCSSTEALSAVSALAAFVETLANAGAKVAVSSHFHDLPGLPRVRALAPSVGIYHLHTTIDEGGAITFDRRLRPGPGSPEYGLSIMRAMSMPQAFLRAAEANRRDLVGLGGSAAAPHKQVATSAALTARAEVVDGPPKRSKYNSKLSIGLCEECGAVPAEETHHLVPRAVAAAAGLPKKAGNRRGNLAALCGKCHDKLHAAAGDAGGIVAPRRRVFTSRGLVLMDPDVI